MDDRNEKQNSIISKLVAFICTRTGQLLNPAVVTHKYLAHLTPVSLRNTVGQNIITVQTQP